MTMLRGCGTIFIFVALIGLLFLAGTAAITRNIADWRTSAHEAAVAEQVTEQVRVHEEQLTERTRIVVDGNVEIARIQADTDKKTSVAFSLFWLVRFLTWAGAVLVLAGVGLFVAKAVTS